MSDTEIRHAHIFCGIGAGAAGFNRGQARVGTKVARFRCLGGIDVDRGAIEAFSIIAGVPGTVLDLFSAEQYRAFHGHEPPPGWREAAPADLHRAFQDERPHILFLSAPCKGFSGLLSEGLSRSAKYQALNELTLRGIWLALEAYRDDPVELLIFENVPRIAKRGRHLLDQIVALLRAYGYAVAETTHDCGELGGLAQSRKRFLLVARHQEKVPPFLYEPERRRLRGVGEVLDKLPLPGDPLGGPMHRVPSLQWRTWVRLAFVEAGSDWRSLNRLAVEGGTLRDFGIAPDLNWHGGVLGVQSWAEPSGTVTSRSGPTNGTYAVADPRPDFGSGTHQNVYRIGRYDQPARTVTSGAHPAGGALGVADPRVGRDVPRFNNVFRVVRFDETAPAVTGGTGPSAGGVAVADPRPAEGSYPSKYRVTSFGEPAGTVISASTTGDGAFAVADPRRQDGLGEYGQYGVKAWSEPSQAVTGKAAVGAGRFAVADPRYANWHPGASSAKLKVTAWDDASFCVTGSQQVASGALSVADPRPDFARDGRDAYQTGGHYGVLPWTDSSGVVTASGQHDNGRWSVADPRGVKAEGSGVNAEGPSVNLPAAEDRLVAIIRALDGTWHRPFTTLELAALQSLVDPDELFLLPGVSDSKHREWIGNAVPRDSAAAIAGVMGQTLLLAWAGETFMLSSAPIWVRPVAVALSVDTRSSL